MVAAYVSHDGDAVSQYSKIQRSMWGDAKFCALSAPPPNAQTLWVYLLSGQHNTTVPGLVRVRLSALAEERGWDVEPTRVVFEEILAAGMAHYDSKTGVLWLPNALHHNEPQSPNVVAGWRNALALIPECELKTKALAAMRKTLQHVALKADAEPRKDTDPFMVAFDRAVGKLPPMASPNPTGGAKPSPKALVADDTKGFGENGAKALVKPTTETASDGGAPEGFTKANGKGFGTETAKALVQPPKGFGENGAKPSATQEQDQEHEQEQEATPSDAPVRAKAKPLGEGDEGVMETASEGRVVLRCGLAIRIKLFATLNELGVSRAEFAEMGRICREPLKAFPWANKFKSNPQEIVTASFLLGPSKLGEHDAAPLTDLAILARVNLQNRPVRASNGGSVPVPTSGTPNAPRIASGAVELATKKEPNGIDVPYPPRTRRHDPSHGCGEATRVG